MTGMAEASANASSLTDLRATLRAARNPDGGWPYTAGKRSRIEPTCWALLALREAEADARRVEVLVRSWQYGDWLVDTAGTPPNHAFNALAALTLLQSAATTRLAEPITGRLVAAKGTAYPQQSEIRQNNSLQAWSWVEGTFSWVEPTAWCLLLLKRGLAGAPLRGTAERIREAEEMLMDRACGVGGWNYGNSNVFGQELQPYVPTTALTLLALQDRRDHPAVGRALQRLQHDVLSERSVMALSISLICFRVYGVPGESVERTLVALLDERRTGKSALSLGMAACALANPPSRAFWLGAA